MLTFWINSLLTNGLSFTGPDVFVSKVPGEREGCSALMANIGKGAEPVLSSNLHQ
jgi:hypothetical protein